jgi:uncharacterized membrane protein YidH (DUF202 family)
MGENQTVSIMLFVLGLFLVAIGIGLSTVTQMVTNHRNYPFYRYVTLYQETIQPYVSIGAIMVIVGIVVLIGAFINTQRKKTVKMEMSKSN